jgi:hypothetical protein
MRKNDLTTVGLSRSPGELAFDRCFYPFGTLLLLCFFRLFGELLLQSGTDQRKPPFLAASATTSGPAWLHWLPFACGWLLCAYWVWAFFSVVRSWRDPRVRILRISALFLLFFDASIALSLLGSRRY